MAKAKKRQTKTLQVKSKARKHIPRQAMSALPNLIVPKKIFREVTDAFNKARPTREEEVALGLKITTPVRRGFKSKAFLP